MTGRRRRWIPPVVIACAVTALVASIVWLAAGPASWQGGTSWQGGNGPGPVRDSADAGRAAQRFADGWGLHVGEVMQFSNGYYAELLDSAGHGATEVLVDPGSGAVHLEFGPAMMWNTAYGMMPAASSSAPQIGSDQARRIAEQWLATNQPGLRSGDAEAFPGYYTLHTMRGDQIVGMLSVHAQNGTVWYHTWHGEFIRMQEPPAARGQPRG